MMRNFCKFISGYKLFVMLLLPYCLRVCVLVCVCELLNLVMQAIG